MAYQQFGSGEGITIAGVTIGKNGPPSEITNREDCDGESNGGWLVWRNGSCKVTGGSGSEDKNNDGVGDKDTTNPNLKNLNSEADCEGAGGSWCSSVDLNNKSYAFCNTTKGSGIKTCNSLAAEKGYSILLGSVDGVRCMQRCSASDVCTWEVDSNDVGLYSDYPGALEKANSLCESGKGKINFGTGSFICREGVKGEGDVVYSGGACTALNGKKYSGSLGCFCGTVQVDTGSGHTSYKSNCGCDKEEKTTTTTVNPSPSPSPSPVMACTGLTQAPAAPKVGDKVTFTCAGTVTPSSAGTLTYKFRYSINSGATTSLTNKTPTTAELTIAACGEYKVECQTCATISGALKCDPSWTGATQ